MGFGLIVSGGEDGLYQVALDYGVASRDAWVAAIDGWIERLNIQIANAEADLVVARNERETAEAELQSLIGELGAAIGADIPRLQSMVDLATQKFARASAREDAIRIPRELSIAERVTLAKRKGVLLSATMQETRSAWCADLTEDASGYVATIEIPGEDQAVLIAPGGRQPTAADGALRARELLTPEQAFFNAAILPGWQKWKPTFRKATILAIAEDEDKADVEIDPTTSSANRLNVNQATRLEGVPIQYMECNAAAFVVGDRVVVEFQGQDWKQPKVIGFVEQPKPCAWICIGDVFESPTYLKCMRPGLVADLQASASVQFWLNGAGPQSPAPVSPGVWQFHWSGSEYGSPLTAGDAAIVLNFNDPITAVIPGGFPVLTPEGAAGVFVSPPWPPSSGTARNIVEVLVRLGGLKVLHIAMTDKGWDLSPNWRTQQIKGVPIRMEAASQSVLTLLDGYTFVGA